MWWTRRVSITTFIRNSQNQKINKLNNIKVFERKKIKEPKQDRQNRLRSHLPPEEGEP